MEWYKLVEWCKQFLVVFKCLLFTPAMVTLEIKKFFYYVIPKMLRTLEESRASNYKSNLNRRHNGDLLGIFGKKVISYD